MASSNFVGISDGFAGNGLHWLATSTAVPPLRNAWHHVQVTTQAGVLTVWVDGTQLLSQAVALPPSVLVGFTGGSGGATDLHDVANVKIYAFGTVPPGVLSASSAQVSLGSTY